jgi:hypothetical protein
VEVYGKIDDLVNNAFAFTTANWQSQYPLHRTAVVPAGSAARGVLFRRLNTACQTSVACS